MNFDLFPRTILLTRAGSRAYGMHTPSSDLDVKGVAIPPEQYFTGLEVFEQADRPGHFQDQRFLDLLTAEEREVVKETKLEGSVYEIRKFFKLALDGNPNILDVLFCRDEDVLSWGPKGEGRALREVRDLFISAKCKFTFSGYAFAQLKRINLHRRWLLQPPDHKPSRVEYDLPESTLIPADQLAAAESMVKKKLDEWEFDFSTIKDDAERAALTQQIQSTVSEVIAGLRTDVSERDAKWRAAVRAVGLDDNLLFVLERERAYRGAKAEWDSYEQWKRTRNKDRAGLEAQYGYDTKHGAHLVRLLRMGQEIMETGQVKVWRGDIDADELKAIRNGEWSFAKLVDFATGAEQELHDLYDSKSYVVPHSPDRVRASAICAHIVRGMRS